MDNQFIVDDMKCPYNHTYGHDNSRFDDCKFCEKKGICNQVVEDPKESRP